MTRPGHLKKGHILSRVPFLGRRMFSETKGIGEEHKNGLQRPDYFGNTCGPKKQKSPINGYTSKERRAQLDITGQTDLTRRPPGKGLQHNSASVNYGLGECSFVVHRHQTEPHPFLRKCALDAPAQFRGHGNCGVPVCAAEPQSASVLTEQHASDWKDTRTLSRSPGRVMQDLNGPCLGNEVMLTTKDVNKPTTNHLKCQAGQESGTFSSKQTERAIRDQIQKVVVNLEDVLHGLKEIHLEMKEVVQRIDLLTADIEMGKEEPGDTFRRCHSQGVQPDEPSSKKDAPPAYPIRDQGQVDLKSVTSQECIPGTSSKRRSRKPPPYPYASNMGNPKDRSLNMPPYPFRRRLLSTIV